MVILNHWIRFTMLNMMKQPLGILKGYQVSPGNDPNDKVDTGSQSTHPGKTTYLYQQPKRHDVPCPVKYAKSSLLAHAHN